MATWSSIRFFIEVFLISWPKYGGTKQPLFFVPSSYLSCLRWLQFPPERLIKLLQAKLKDTGNYQRINTNTSIPSTSRPSERWPARTTSFLKLLHAWHSSTCSGTLERLLLHHLDVTTLQSQLYGLHTSLLFTATFHFKILSCFNI